MTSGSVRMLGLIAPAMFLVWIVGCLVGFRVGIGILKEKIVEALGPDSEIASIRVGWSSVEVEGLRIKGQKGWPAAEELRAASCCVGAIGARPSVRAARPSCSGLVCAG